VCGQRATFRAFLRGKEMKTIWALLLAFGLSATAQAACVGSPGFQTCTDNSGNSYSVQRFGGSTYMQGRNSATGSNWSQQSHTVRSEEHTSELQSRENLVCRLLLE